MKPISPRQGYVLVTPARNEVNTIGRTIDSVVRQSVRPREWIIVSDGSTDGTDEVVRRAARDNPWIRLLPAPKRGERSFARVVHNTQAGIDALQCRDYAYLGLLDADLEFAPPYFETLLGKLEQEPELGLTGGVVIDRGLPRDRFPRNRLEVPGAVQLFRRECFESLGGLVPIAEGGWDCLTCAMARMQGYRTRLDTTVVVDHLKPRNISQGGYLKRFAQLGVRDYAIGYDPWFELVKCIGRLSERPIGVAAVARWIGFCFAAATRRNTIVPSEVVAFVRREQRERIRRAARSLTFRKAA